jgi:hypothetical protein
MELFAWLIQTIVACGVAIVGAIGLSFTKVGERFFCHMLEGRLAELKHANDRAVEQIKADFGHLGDRWKRSNEREYEALSGAWVAFVDAFLATNQAVMAFRISRSKPDERA